MTVNISDINYNTNATPESAITGSIGDMVIDATNGNLYLIL